MTELPKLKIVEKEPNLIMKLADEKRKRRIARNIRIWSK